MKPLFGFLLVSVFSGTKTPGELPEENGDRNHIVIISNDGFPAHDEVLFERLDLEWAAD